MDAFPKIKIIENTFIRLLIDDSYLFSAFPDLEDTAISLAESAEIHNEIEWMSLLVAVQVQAPHIRTTLLSLELTVPLREGACVVQS